MCVKNTFALARQRENEVCIVILNPLEKFLALNFVYLSMLAIYTSEYDMPINICSKQTKHKFAHSESDNIAL